MYIYTINPHTFVGILFNYMWQELSASLLAGDVRALARSISLVENERDGYLDFLRSLPAGKASIIGLTGPPGAGKSTLVDALIGDLVSKNKKVAVLCIDPSSPFNLGAVLGDRIRMNQWYNHPSVYIRSLATRGSLGGLTHSIVEVTSILNAAAYDYILVETVGIGQSEVEIAGLADLTVVVLVPEAGDEIQTMKAGLMEIADIFVVNKSDRPGADSFVRNLRQMLAPSFQRHTTEVPIVKTAASNQTGIPELVIEIEKNVNLPDHERKILLQASRVVHILQRLRMKGVDLQRIKNDLAKLLDKPDFNLFDFALEINKAFPGS